MVIQLVKQSIWHKNRMISTKDPFVQSKACFVMVNLTLFPARTSQQNMYAKQILRIAVAQTAIALSQAMDDEPNVEQLEHVVGKGLSTFTSGYFTVFLLCFTVFATILIGMCSVCFMMHEPEPESSYDGSESESEASRRRRYMFLPLGEASDPELWQELRHHDFSSDEEIEEPDTVQHTPQVGPDDRIPLRPNMVRCYALLSASFTRLKQLMMRDPRQRGRCFAVLYQLQQVFHAFEENRPNASNYSLLHQMMASICQMEEVARIQVASSFEIDDVEAVVNDLDSELNMQADVPTDSEVDGSLLYQGDMPEPSEPMSPESIAGWTVRRLSRRIYSAVVSGSKALRRYFAMREIMRGTVLVCQRSELDRRRAMSMLHDIRDLSDHSSSNDSQRDPMEDFTSDLPGDDGMDLSETFQGDIYDCYERIYGPVDDVKGVPLKPSTIPAYVIINGQMVYTIEFAELPDEAVQYDVDGDWTYYTFLGHRYRVRKYLTMAEPNDVASSSNAMP